MEMTNVNDTKILIRSVLIAASNEIFLTEFLCLYQSFVGKRLPYCDLGFGSPLDLLYSMPDVVEIKEKNGKHFVKAVYDEKTKHLERLILNQRPPDQSCKKREVKVFNVVSKTLFRISFVRATLKAEILHIIKHFEGHIQFCLIPLAYEKIFKKPLVLENGQVSLAEILFPIKQLKLFSSDKIIVVYDTEYDPAELLTCQDDIEYHEKKDVLKCNQNFDKSGVSKTVQQIFIKVMEQHFDGILAVDFPSACEKIANGSFSLHALGYASLAELVDALPDIFRREKISGNIKDYIILPSSQLRRNFLQQLSS